MPSRETRVLTRVDLSMGNDAQLRVLDGVVGGEEAGRVWKGSGWFQRSSPRERSNTRATPEAEMLDILRHYERFLSTNDPTVGCRFVLVWTRWNVSPGRVGKAGASVVGVKGWIDG